MSSHIPPPVISSSSWAPEPVPPVGYLSRKALPIKRNDAEALTREDVQHDLLNYIFSDTNRVFTTPPPAKPEKVTFTDLYVGALYRSSRCSKVLKDKMLETPAFAVELAKFALLINVGRINTTMAFFPEMKTALRTYHPVPSLQKSDGNAQDAPRIKNCLKAALLPSEVKSSSHPQNPDDILARKAAGVRPPTSVVNLVFVLSAHAGPLSSVHFDGNLNFLDLFLPRSLASADRARAFLWMIYHYLEEPSVPNPFADQFAMQHRDKAPLVRKISKAEKAKENVDTREEIEWGKKMSAERNMFLQKLVSQTDMDKKPRAPYFVSGGPEQVNSSSPVSLLRHRPSKAEASKDDGPFMFYVPGQDAAASASAMPQASTSTAGHHQPAPQFSSPDRDMPGPSTSRFRLNSPPPAPGPSSLPPPRPHAHLHPQSYPSGPPPRHEPARPGPESGSLLHRAWQSILNSADPLADSDEEYDDDEMYNDYSQRLQVLRRVRGRSLTPERAPPQVEYTRQPQPQQLLQEQLQLQQPQPRDPSPQRPGGSRARSSSTRWRHYSGTQP